MAIGDKRTFHAKTSRKEDRWVYNEHPDGSFNDATGEDLAKMLNEALQREERLRAKISALCQKCKGEMNSV